MATGRICAIPGCGKPAKARGWCSAHWGRWHKHGDPNHLLVSPLDSTCSVSGCEGKPHTRWKGGETLCNKHWLRVYHHGGTDLSPANPMGWKKCSIDGCPRDSRSAKGSYCELHYYRLRRTGSSADRKPVASQTSHGYLSITCHTHPVSGRSGTMYLHRQVLFDSIGAGQHPCHWCGSTVEWFGQGSGKLVVDHVDGNKINNAPENLVSSCHRCNSSRGLFMSWVMKHRDDPFLWALYREARSE